eukprot:174806-Amphidinium_carterae.1
MLGTPLGENYFPPIRSTRESRESTFKSGSTVVPVERTPHDFQMFLKLELQKEFDECRVYHQHRQVEKDQREEAQKTCQYLQQKGTCTQWSFGTAPIAHDRGKGTNDLLQWALQCPFGRELHSTKWQEQHTTIHSDSSLPSFCHCAGLSLPCFVVALLELQGRHYNLDLGNYHC